MDDAEKNKIAGDALKITGEAMVGYLLRSVAIFLTAAALFLLVLYHIGWL